MLDVGMTISQVDAPTDRICQSGHPVPEDAIYQGKPTRFFSVTGTSKSYGIFCEPCLVIANYLAQKQKNGPFGTRSSS
jgi:hypothetical protein